MIAAVASTIPTADLEVREVADPAPSAGDLVLEVEACGICGTDLHILEGASYRPEPPFILGHEPVGRVVSAGSSTDSHWIGQRVTVSLFTGCGSCAWCRAGDERLCPDLVSITGVLTAPGGFAQRLRIRTAQAVVVPASLTSPQASTLVDAGATAANSIRAAGSVPDGLLVVVGGGPVGFLCAELARKGGWTVIVVQASPARRDALVRLGHTVVSRLEDVPGRPTVVVDAAGTPTVAPWAIGALAPRGLLVAAAYGPLERFDLAPAARKELRIVGVRSGRRNDLVEVLAAAADGSIRLPEISTWPLRDINDAFTALRAKSVPGKAVILPAMEQAA